TEYAVVNVKSLAAFSAGAAVDPQGLVDAGLIKNSGRARGKILGNGDVPHALTGKAHAGSGSARSQIEAAGGRNEPLAARGSGWRECGARRASRSYPPRAGASACSPW